MSDIVVFGGTKFFGILLVEKLLAAGHRVTIISRSKELPPSLRGRVNHVNEDISFRNEERPEERSERIRKILEGKKFDIVVDNISWLAGEVSGLAKAIVDSGNVLQQYILCSSVAVYNDWNKFLTSDELPKNLLRESEVNLDMRGYLPDIYVPSFKGFFSAYVDGKRSTEKELTEASASFGFPYTIMRPSVIEGENDLHHRTWYWVQRLLDGEPILIPPSDTKTIYRHVNSSDVAEAFFKAVGNKHAFNETFNVAGEEILTVEEYIYKLAEALGGSASKVKLVGVSSKEACETIPNFEFPPFFSGLALISDIHKAKEKLQYKPTPIDKWMKGLVNWLVERKTTLPNSLGYEKRRDEIDLAKSCQSTLCARK